MAEVPTATPILTEVAINDASSNGYVTISELRTKFPATFMDVDYSGKHAIEVTVNPDKIAALKGVDGQPIPLGIYVDTLPNVDPAAFDYSLNFGNNVHDRPAYIVGILSNMYESTMINVAVPIEKTGKFASIRVSFNNGGMGGRLIALDTTGNSLGLPNFAPKGFGGLQRGTDPRHQIVFDQSHNTLKFPTPKGESDVHIGDPVIVRFVYNIQDTPFADSYVNGAGHRTPDQWIADLEDADPSNDGTPGVFPFSLAVVYSPPQK